MKTKFLLENGIMFEGDSLGAYGETVGEVCFNTGMTGYQEIMTDPSYCNQIVIMTYPHIGNYGINIKDMESSKIQLAGLVVKEATEFPSNFRSLGKQTGLGFQFTSGAKREIKARSRTIDKYLQSIEKKSYDLAKSFEGYYNTATTSPASKEYYLDQVLVYLKGQMKLSQLPKQTP